MHALPFDTLPDPVEKPEFYESVTTKRFIAWIIDTVLTFVFAVVVSLLTLGIGFFVFFFIALVAGFLYRWMTLAGGSSTWGMRMMAIELREGDGQRLRSSTALWHTVGYYVSFSTAMLQGVSILTMVMTDRHQSLSDMILDTAMINKPL